MKEIFKLNMKLRSKEIKIDKISGTTQFILIISAIFLFLKCLSSLTSSSYAVKELCALFLAFMGFSKIRTDSITQREIDFVTFFPRFNRVQIRKYFMYKKVTITYIFIIYMLSPTSVDILEIKSFLMFGVPIYLYMFLDTLFFYVTESTKRSNILYTALRISYYIIFASYLYISNAGINLEKILSELKLRHMISLFTILFCANPLLLKSSNQKRQWMTKLIFHYILRDRIKYEIVVILFISVSSSTNSSQNLYGLNFCATLLGILFILYFSVMNTHKSKFLLLYQPRNVKHLRKDATKSTCYLSSIFLVLAVILDFSIIKSIYLTEYYFVSMVILYISTRIVKVSIEKNTKIDESIIKLKECVFVLCSAIILVGAILITKILIFSNSL